MRVPELEVRMGIEVYGTETLGIGGRIKQIAEDFIVEEMLIDGSMASIKPKEISEISGKGDHLVCVLMKRNWDMFLAVREITRRLRLGRKRARFAGIKDARAVTAQHVSFWNVAPKEVTRFHIKGVEIRPLRFSTQPVRLRHLLGNMFRVTIRQVRSETQQIKDQIGATLEELKALGGIPNFYGHQRFGTTRSITHVVGRSLVKKNSEEAALTFLAEPSPHEKPEAFEARRTLKETRDYKRALREFPQDLTYELAMLNRLAQHPDDYVNAFRQLPKRLCRIFVQAYQAYLFNRTLSQRLRLKLPFYKLETGDHAVELDRNGLPIREIVRVTTANEREVNRALQTGEMSLALPLVGFRSGPSDNLKGGIERAIMEEEDVQPEDFYIADMPEISVMGGFRTAIAPISDFEILEMADDDLNPGKSKATLGFSLLRGSYATIALRELMKNKDPVAAGF